MSIRLILVLISFFFLQNTPSVSANGYVRFANFSPDEVFFSINSVTLPSTKSGFFTGFFSFAPGTQNITIVNTSFSKTFTGTFTVTDLVSKFVAVVSDGASSYLLDNSPEVTVTSAPVGQASVIVGNYAPLNLAASVDGTVHAFYTPTDYTEEIFVNTTAPSSFTNTTTRNITIELVVGGTSSTSFTLQIQSQAKYLVLAGLASNGSVQYTVVQYSGNKVQFSYLCNQVWTATNPDPYPITFKWDWRPRKKRFSLTLAALSSNLVVVETKQNANSKKIYTYQYDSDHLTQKFVQTIFDKKCLSVSPVCRGKYKLTNLATRALPVVYESFSPSGLNDGTYTTLTNSTFVTLPLSSTKTVNTTAVSAPYFKTGYQEVFKVWLAVNGAKSRLLTTFQGAVAQGSKCT